MIHLLYFLNLYQHAKNRVDLSILNWYIVDREIMSFDYPRVLLTQTNKNFSNKILFAFSLSQHAKKWSWLTQLFLRYSWFKNPDIWLAESIFDHAQTTFYVYWIYINDWSILQSDWLRAFWPVNQELKFLQIRNRCRQIAKSMIFHLTPNPEKSHAKSFAKPKSPYFRPILPIFGQKWIISTIWAVSF